MARIWIGDSRGVGMSTYFPESNSDKYIVKGAMSFVWFRDTAIPELRTMLSSSGHKVIIMMGVNDCANHSIGGNLYDDDYAEQVNTLVAAFPGNAFYFMSVNPVDGDYPSSYHPDGAIPQSDLNRIIDTFNATIKSKCRARYLDTCTYLRTSGFSTFDGIHYTKDTYTKIYEYAVDFVAKGGGYVVNFKPRTTAPSRDDPWWISSSKGGKNDCIIVYGCALADGKSCLPNCVGYAWGRFSEIMNEKCKLSTSNAEDWWGHTSDGYERGQTPKLGAVICWSKGQVGYQYDDGAGHVAIVEKINDDGSIVTSESGWQSSTLWWTTTRSNSDGNWGAGSSYKFQGFIYNPAVKGSFMIAPLSPVEDRLSYFLDAAQELIGKQDFWKTIKASFQDEKFTNGVKIQYQHDSIAYVMHCTRCVNGLLDVVIPDVSSCSDLGKVGVENKYGFWYDGPANGKDDTWAYPGDIVHIRTLIKDRDTKYSCEELGIVVNVIENGTKFEAAMCDYSLGVQLVTFKLDSDQIAGYYRPDWKQVNASVLNLLGYVFGLSVYTEISSKKDSVMREVCYLNNRLEPSIRSSNLRLSVINYTSGISALFLASGGGLAFGPITKFDDLILEGFNAVQCSIIEQLMSYGLNAAQALGILANIRNESGFRPDAVGDNGTSFGLCQWHLGRGDAMKAHCGGGDKWKTDVTGQISYLWKELNGSHKHAYNEFKDCPNTLQGCRTTAEQFCIHFEVPADRYVRAAERADQAEIYWNQAVNQLS